MPSIVVQPDGSSQFILRTLTSIGSDADNDIRIDGDGVQATHAHIKIDQGRFLLMGLSRSHPVHVNGKKSRKHVLEHGDEMKMGACTLRFNLWDEPNTMEIGREALETDQLTAYRKLAQFCEFLAKQDQLPTLFETLMDEIIDLTGADKGFLMMLESEELRICTARNINRESISGSLEQVSDSIIGKVIQSRKPLIVSDALNDTNFQSSVSVMQLKLCSVMCVPLLFGGQLLGLIYVGNDNIVNLFDQRSLNIFTVFASQASMLIASAIQKDELRGDNARLRAELENQRFGQLVGSCEAMKAVFRRVEKVAGTDINVLILGETGTGKELVARELHRRSPRCDGPFIAVNCGAIPENLMESTLFGHRKGAFTGALENRTGSFEAAGKGTLFLDEIGEMPSHLQVKLLRAIQERKITPLGGSRPIEVDIRLVAATHIDLEQAIKTGAFREDLYYRINVVSVNLPPLRERQEDVVLLARYLLKRFADEYSQSVRSFDRQCITALRKHHWPGNIRELENRIKKAVVLADGPQLSAADLDLTPTLLGDRILPLNEARDAFLSQYIDRALSLNNGNRTQAAKDLGVDPRTIFRHLEKRKADEH